jgi:hypothetical protein
MIFKDARIILPYDVRKYLPLRFLTRPAFTRKFGNKVALR